MQRALRAALTLSRGIIISAFVLAIFTSPTKAQTQITTGTIQGTVIDANGAALPDANVELKNIDTNFSRTASTDEEGRFIALQLPPGRYTLTITKSGFATLIVENAEVTVGSSLNLPVQMKVSGVQETVTINATPTIDTSKTESSTN